MEDKSSLLKYNAVDAVKRVPTLGGCKDGGLESTEYWMMRDTSGLGCSCLQIMIEFITETLIKRLAITEAAFLDINEVIDKKAT